MEFTYNETFYHSHCERCMPATESRKVRQAQRSERPERTPNSINVANICQNGPHHVLLVHDGWHIDLCSAAPLLLCSSKGWVGQLHMPHTTAIQELSTVSPCPVAVMASWFSQWAGPLSATSSTPEKRNYNPQGANAGGERQTQSRPALWMLCCIHVQHCPTRTCPTCELCCRQGACLQSRAAALAQRQVWCMW